MPRRKQTIQATQGQQSEVPNMRNLQLHPYFQSSLPPIVDAVDSMPKGNLYPWPGRAMGQIDTIVVHHMASEAPLVNQALYHINGRGWRGIGYHIVIDTDKILQVNDLMHITHHCSNYNTRGIGVSIRGDLSKRALTEIERKLLNATLVTLKALFPKAEIKAHRELSATSCPCTDVNLIRSDVFALEQEIEQMSAPQKKEELAYRMANQILYLQRLSQGKTSTGADASEGQMKWALAELLKMEPEFRKLGWLK